MSPARRNVYEKDERKKTENKKRISNNNIRINARYENEIKTTKRRYILYIVISPIAITCASRLPPIHGSVEYCCSLKRSHIFILLYYIRERVPPQQPRLPWCIHEIEVNTSRYRVVSAAMSGFHAMTTLLTVAAAVVLSGDRCEVAGTDGPAAVAAYSLSGQNIEWPCTSTKSVYADTGRYVAKNVIATRVQVWGDRAFVLTSRFRSGVPFTVSTVRLECEHRCWPVLSPYPCWALHDEGDPNAIQNAVDIYLDPTGLLWVLDSGLVNTVEQPVRRSQPRIFAIDVKTDKVVKQFDLSGLVCSASRLNYITADYGDDGKAFVYVSDAATRAVIVWEVEANRSFRVVLPKAITHDCTGRRDVLYIALAKGPAAGGGSLYLTYLTSNRMYRIDTCNLRRGCSEGTVADLGPKPEKMVILGTDSRTTLYFRYRGQGDVYAWDTDRPGDGTSFGSDRFTLVRKVDDCGRLATHVAPDNQGGVLWILESNFPDYISGAVGCLGANVRLQPLVVQCGK